MKGEIDQENVVIKDTAAEDVVIPEMPEEDVNETEPKVKEEESEAEEKQSGVQKAMAALNDDDAEHVSWSFDAVLNGEILASKQLKRQVPFALMIIIMLILYVSNRYNAQQEMINIDNLKKEKNEMRYRATARSSQLLQKSRESQVVEFFRNTPDSTLNISNKPPFIIYTDKE